MHPRPNPASVHTLERSLSVLLWLRGAVRVGQVHRTVVSSGAVLGKKIVVNDFNAAYKTGQQITRSVASDLAGNTQAGSGLILCMSGVRTAQTPGQVAKLPEISG